MPVFRACERIAAGVLPAVRPAKPARAPIGLVIGTSDSIDADSPARTLIMLSILTDVTRARLSGLVSGGGPRKQPFPGARSSHPRRWPTPGRGSCPSTAQGRTLRCPGASRPQCRAEPPRPRRAHGRRGHGPRPGLTLAGFKLRLGCLSMLSSIVRLQSIPLCTLRHLSHI